MKKVFALISLCLVGVLLITTVVLSLIKKDYTPDISLEPHAVYVCYNGTRGAALSESESEELLTLLKSNFEINYLTSLFQGKASVSPVVKEKTTSYIPGFNSSGYSDSAYTYIELQFNTQYRIKENNKDFDSNKDNSVENPVLYNSLFIQINNIDGLSDLSIYYKNDETFSSYYTQAMLKHAEVYEWIQDKNA